MNLIKKINFQIFIIVLLAILFLLPRNINYKRSTDQFVMNYINQQMETIERNFDELESSLKYEAEDEVIESQLQKLSRSIWDIYMGMRNAEPLFKGLENYSFGNLHIYIQDLSHSMSKNGSLSTEEKADLLQFLNERRGYIRPADYSHHGYSYKFFRFRISEKLEDYWNFFNEDRVVKSNE